MGKFACSFEIGLSDGFLFMWIIPSKEEIAKQWMVNSGFEVVDRVSWIKLSNNNNMITSLALHFGKCKEDILVGRIGDW